MQKKQKNNDQKLDKTEIVNPLEVVSIELWTVEPF